MFTARSAFSLLFTLCCSASLAQPSAQDAKAEPKLRQAEAMHLILQKGGNDIYGGIVTNQTITQSGQDFYFSFMQAWQDKEGNQGYTLSVRERPSARSGSEIRIEYAQNQVFISRLPRARAEIKQLGQEAADASYQAVLETEGRRVSNDADIAADEL